MSENKIEMMTEKFITLSLKIKLPGSGAIITSDASLYYFKKGLTGQNGTTVYLGVQFKSLNEYEQAAILQALRKGNHCRPSTDNGIPWLVPQFENQIN